MRELAPLGVLATAAHFGGEGLQPAERRDLRLQLLDGRGRRRLIEDLFLCCLDLVFGCLVEIFYVVVVEQRPREYRRGRRTPALKQLQLAQALLEALASATERLVDGLRRRCQASLQDGEREADCSGALVVLQRLGAVELLTHVLGDFLVEPRLGVGELVWDRVGDPFGEKRARRRT